MKKLSLALFLVLFGVSFMAAQRTVSGMVSDEDGDPLIGASVLAKGTAVGTVTDIDGKYTLDVPAGSTILVFSYTGFSEKEVVLGASNAVNTTLSEGVLLETAVVTALGVQREEKALGYAVSQLDGGQLQQVAEVDPLRALQGKVAGVNIGGSSGAAGSSTRITIRGNSSLLGNNQPLFVVDGIPYDNSEFRTNTGLAQGGSYGSRIGDIDPNNIEDITILRGAAAAALWGSRAANGVVMITTKTGSGTNQKGLGVSFSTSVGFETIANLPNYQNSYGTGTGFAYQQANGSWGAPFIGERPYADLETIPHWYAGRAGWNGEFDNVQVPYQAYPDNVENLFQTGITYDNSLTLTGGNEKSSIGTTISFANQEGYVPNTGFDRFNFSVGGSTKLTDRFRVSSNVGLTRTEQNGVLSGVGSLGGNNSSAFARTLLLGRNWDVHGQPFQNPTDLGSEFMVSRGQADNPLWSYENAGFTSQVNRVTASALLSFDVTKWLTANYRAGINQYDQTNIEFIRPGSTGPSNNPGLGEVIDHRISFQELESNFFLQGDFDLSDKIGLQATLGHNVNQRTTDQLAYQGLGYVVFDIDQIRNTNNVTPFRPATIDGLSKRRLIGVYADLSFDYGNWAYVNFSARNDWSSTLAKDDNSYFYPAVSASISVLDALDISNNVLDFVKVRGGFAQVGNDASPYLLQTVFNTNGTLVTNPAPTVDLPFEGNPGSSLSRTAGNPTLQREITREFEAGLDVKMFKGRVDLGATYYSRLTIDQIIPITVPESSGFVQFITNFGEVSNKGVELTLTVNPVRINDFRWDVTGLFTHNKNIIEDLPDEIEEIPAEQGSAFAGSIFGVFIEGEEYGVLKGSTNARTPEGDLLINPTNGQLIPNMDLEVIGNPNPDFTVSLNNNFSWKGLRLGVLWDWTQGGDIFSNQVQSMLGRGVLAFQGDRERNAVIPGVYGNPTNGEPFLDEAGNYIPNQTMVEENDLWFGNTFASNGQDEWSVFDATVFRLREVSLGYSLPQSLLGDSFIKGIDISIVGRNLWFFAPGLPEDSNFDPEVNQFGASSNQRGIEYGATPTIRRYAINARFTF